MKKKELRALPTLRATDKMMQMARADEFKKRKQRYGVWVEGYEKGFYLRSQVYGRILKVAVYLTEYMRMGVRDAAFEVYVDKEHSRFLTYDRLRDRWRTAKVDCLPWPRYVYYSTGHYIHPHEAKTIQQYFGGAHGGYTGLLEYQKEVREDSLPTQVSAGNGPLGCRPRPDTANAEGLGALVSESGHPGKLYFLSVQPKRDQDGLLHLLRAGGAYP